MIHSRVLDGTAKTSPGSEGMGPGGPARLRSAPIRLHFLPPSIERARDFIELLMPPPPRHSTQTSAVPVVAKATATKPEGVHAVTEDHRLPPSAVRTAGEAPI